jgi:hypothetical protein
MKIPITEFQLPIPKTSSAAMGSSVITIYLKKSNKKKPLLKTASGRNNVNIKPSNVSSVKQKI